MSALERDLSKRYPTAADLERDLRGFLKARHVVVPASGVAALLKRVVGDRIEQRRRALRSALRELGQGAKSVELLPSDPAFTPTGSERGSRSGVSGVSGAGSSASARRAPSRPSAPRGRLTPAGASSYPRQAVNPATLGYAVGIGGVAIAILVLLLFRR
jgi:hypothetical protein